LTGVAVEISLSMVAALLGIALTTGLLAGVYPAFVLSGFRPVAVLKGSFSHSRQGSRFRSVLVVFQFAISIAMIVGTAVVFKQLRFIQDRDLGFVKDQVVVLPIESNQAVAQFEVFREALLEHPGVIEAAAANGLPGPDHIHQTTVFTPEGDENNIHLAGLAEVSFEYVQTLGLEIIAGRDFSRDYPSDANAWLINEAAASEFGWSAEEAVGQRVNQTTNDDNVRLNEVVGVFRNAHFNSLHTAVEPLFVGMQNRYRYLPVRMHPEQTTSVLAHMRDAWASFEPDYPFRYWFMDEDYARFYAQEQRLSSIYTTFAMLSIIIACLGLLGLASFVTAQRTREIGVRKVLGASVPGIVKLLSRDFTALVLIACVVAFPVAWYAMTRWLEDFAYATSIGVGVFVLAASSALLIAWLTIAWQAIRAARANPVDSLQQTG